MSKPKIEVTSEQRDYNEYLKIDKAIITETSESGESITYNRFKLTRPDAVAVILYNSDEDSVVLVKQHRYPTHGKVTSDIIEIIAGKVDEGEDPSQAVIREVQEEVGYLIKEQNLIYKSSFFASPGYSSEIIHLYAASVTNADKISEGGGLSGEHENIEILHIPVNDFFNMFTRGEIIDSKSIIGAYTLWHLRNDDRVEIGLKFYEQKRLDDAIKTSNEVANDIETKENAKE